MIGKLKGYVEETGEDWVLIDVGGVGYHVECSAHSLRALPVTGERVSMIVHTHVREQEIRLFGFLTAAERDWFRVLQNVQGVGARVALAVMGTLGPGGMAQAVIHQDKTAVAQTPGIGPKLAQRIVSELKDKVPATQLAVVGGDSPITPAGQVHGAQADAISALVNLGYPELHASQAVAAAQARTDADANAEVLIRYGLRELAR